MQCSVCFDVRVSAMLIYCYRMEGAGIIQHVVQEVLGSECWAFRAH